MRILCCGGIGEHGRSCLLLKADDGSYLMVDCGVAHEFTPGHPGRYPSLPADLPDSFPLLLTHTHEDHVAAVPRLMAEGYRPQVYATPLTVELAPGYCRTWLKAVDKAIAASGGQRPYSEEDISAIAWHTLPHDGAFRIGPWTLRHGMAAHAPGSCWFLLSHAERPSFSIGISGDWTNKSVVYPSPEFPSCDLFITDASGSEKDDEGREQLKMLLSCSQERPILLPLPVVGRSQEMLAVMASMPELAGTAGAVVMDRTLVSGLDIWLKDKDISARGRAALIRAKQLFESGQWIAVSRAEDIPHGPRVIGAANAMLSSGLSAAAGRQVLAEDGLILFSGHAAPGTPGRQLLDSGHPQIRRLPWKVHPSMRDVEKATSAVRPSSMILVHTPLDRARSMAAQLEFRCGTKVFAPAVGDMLTI